MSELIPKRPSLAVPMFVDPKLTAARFERADLTIHPSKTKRAIGRGIEVHAR